MGNRKYLGRARHRPWAKVVEGVKHRMVMNGSGAVSGLGSKEANPCCVRGQYLFIAL